MKCAVIFLLVGVAAFADASGSYAKLGCYIESDKGTVIFNRRSEITWINYLNFVKKLAADCEAEAKKANYKYFSIRFYGICAGFNSRNGIHPYNKCMNPFNWKECTDTATICVGQESADQLYEVGRDGGYGSWAAYGDCSVTCGKGVKTRERKCDTPTKIANGKTCDHLGPSTETKPCSTPTQCPVDGKYGKWSKYGDCSVSCGGGTKTRTRKCDSPAPSHGGKDCVGHSSGSIACGLLKCPVDGKFGKWSEFSKCTATCGGGSKTRTRSCDSPPPSDGGKDCVGALSETQKCGTEVCPVDGKYGKWSTYGKCSVYCGGGTQTRSRKCNAPAPVGTGKDCVGPSSESRACGNGACAVDGGFSEWTAFTVCKKTCGGGSQVRSRTCTNPTPQGGGKDCVGPRTETKACGNPLCPGPKGVAKAQELVETFLKTFHNIEYPDKTPSGKFYKAIFDIQKAIAEEFISVDPTTKGKTLEQRLKDLEEFLRVATAGGSIDYARSTLGKGLFTFMKKKINEGLPIDDIDKAAGNYLNKIKGMVGEENFNKIVSSQGDSTLMFTMDTTGSMAQEINAAKAVARSIIDSTRDFEVDYILSPFNDPSSGPVTYKSQADRAGFVNDINNLRATGGGDCPELAFKGMLDALDKGPKYGSPMFVFTDATAKDDTSANMAALKAAADSFSSTITFFTNLKGCTGGAKTGIKSYQEIATYTSGNIFPLKNEAELLKFTDFVKSSLQQDTMIASGGTLKTRVRRALAAQNHAIQVDDGIATFILSISTSNANTAQYVLLTSPDGKNIAATTTMSMARIFNINKPAVGTWIVKFPSTVGEYQYNAQAVSSDPIEFAHNFMYQENPRRNSPTYSIYNPIKGKTNQMVIRLGGIDRINLPTLRAVIVDVHGSELVSDIKFDYLDSRAILNGTMNPPDVPFKVRLTGLTRAGVKFERSSRGIYSAKTAFMRPTYAGNDFTAGVSQTGQLIQIQVLNQGTEEPITLSAKATYGSVSPGSQRKTIRRFGFFQLSYNGPNDASKRGKTERITLTAVKNNSGERFTASVSMLLK